jgi:predicted esterase
MAGNRSAWFLPRWRAPWTVAIVAAVACFTASSVWASQIVLRDGRVLQGKLALIATTVETPQTASDGKSIVLIDDGLRQTFVPQKQIQEVNELDAGEPVEAFIVPQQICDNGLRVAMVGAITRLTPFDEFGRRILQMTTGRGNESVLQGITEITPDWTKLECVETAKLRYTWDMRVATNTIPRDVLGRVLAKLVDPKNLDQRLKIVRLYLQSERYKDAEEELKGIIADFPDQKPQFQATVVRLRQAHARRILEEIEKRRSAGQHALCYDLLENFPAENVAGETLQQVREMLDDYKKQIDRGTVVVERFDALLKEIKETTIKERLLPIRDEIRRELNLNTLDRMGAFMQFHAEDSMPPEERLALAVSGWLIGGDYAQRNLPTALSMYETRNLMRKYLTTTVRIEREDLLGELKRQEAFIPETVARLLAQMNPPQMPTPAVPAAKDDQNGKPAEPKAKEPPKPAVAGQHRFELDPHGGEPPVEYLVQLPPEYDPHRRYPLIVTLHGSGSTPALQIDWWAGPVQENGNRLGHAGRNGYIVVAPAWGKEQQLACNYADYEHAAVLRTLRDVFRRFSIDTDRVFLSGHSMGGDAGWDIALAHPDLWAGFIGITPVGDKTVNYYWENAEYVPTYLIAGELDGERWVRNGTHMDRYLNRGYDTTIVRFKGRGHEHFSDEILRLFDWMNRRKRDFFPRKFACRSIRTWDNCFWWVETADPPPAAIVDPDNWPPKNYGVLYVKGSLNARNGVYIETGSQRATAWLSPELIDFKRPCDVTIRGKKANKGAYVEPDPAVMLEDARSRADRLHPFWAKVESGK